MSTSQSSRASGSESTSATSDSAPSSSSSASTTVTRSYLDDIDEDDAPPTTSQHEQGKEESKDADKKVSHRNGNGLSASPSSLPSDSTSQPSPTSASHGIVRILRVLADDREVAQSANPAATSTNTDSSSASSSSLLPQPDHCRILGLPQPHLNAIGEPVWPVEEKEINRTFRKLVVLIHPDKNPIEGASTAFEAVKQAHGVLSNEVKRYDYLKSYCHFRRQLAQRASDYIPEAVGMGRSSDCLESILREGKSVSEMKRRVANRMQEKLREQAEARRRAVMEGDAARRKKEELRKQEELKRKVMQSGVSDDSEKSDDDDEDDDDHLSVAEKIRRAKQQQKHKKPRRGL